MPELGLEIIGLEELLDKFASIAVEIMPAMRVKLHQRAQSVFDQSQFLVPVDTGLLRGSGHIIDYEDSVEIVYDADYALVVHEDLTKFHKAPTCAKYLELPMTEQQGALLEDIAIAVNELTGA